MKDDDLDDLFVAARGREVPPSAALMARILADAEAAQPRHVPPAVRPGRPGRFGLGALVAALGGAGALVGLATAGVAGVWIGFAPPAAVDDFAATLWASAEGDSVELIPDLEGMMIDADG